MADQVEAATTALRRKNTTQASACLEEISNQIKRRNKLIRLADKSPAGWDLVNEYLSDELASGSEDEKRIRKAEQAALRRRSNRQRGKSTRRPYPYVPSAPSTSSAPTPFSSSQHQFNTSPRFLSSRPSYRKAAPTDICFACGLQGHWRVDCRRVASALKPSTLGSGVRPPTTGGN